MNVTRHWIASAPAGRWTTGPSVIYSEGVADEYRAIGWVVTGPFVLEQHAGPSPSPPDETGWTP